MPTLRIDENCGLCQRTARFASKRCDVDVIGGAGDTVEFHGKQVHTESAAVVRLLWQMKWGWPLVGGLLWLVPRPVRDAGYRWVAARRHRFKAS